MKAIARAVSAWVCAAGAVCAVGSVGRADGPERRIIEDGQGRAMRVGFDLGSRWLVGGSFDPHDGVWRAEHALLFRERDDEGVRWKLDHAFLEGEVDTRGRWSASLYRGFYLRNSGDGSLVIPTSPPIRITLPVDRGFELALGSVSHVGSASRGEAARERWDVGVVRADVLFDFWRAETAGSYLALRTGMAYGLTGEAEFARLRHVVTPFSRVGLDVAHTFDSGRQAVVGHAVISRRVSVAREVSAWTTEIEAEASWEGVILAVNDAPVALRAGVAWRRGEGRDDVVASVGLRVGVPTD